ncbi:MAG: hypothetical protein LBM87_02130 [Ruminococcus sp.]|jgi:hypothetical protein|nr:hypothetical protein [Ruminococcus sp.]
MEILQELLREKLQIIERYSQATLRMVYDDIYSFGDILSDRQLLIDEYTALEDRINAFLTTLSRDERLIVEEILAGVRTDDENYPDITRLSQKINTAALLINKNDKLAISRVTAERGDILERLQSNQKSSQVIRYVGGASYDVTKGATLNQKY